ncbi:TetR/AcrR family transcriptional regulator [Amycolatopsis sp.]|uniref:TetR/AcrR family transcriptional regulator n=1 Tax=Amycolatopsis sp. TaxID=37632 RepID=UPI002BDB5B0F|nr:TetR/AcrR family transcriptional regulator [Amycolatopsis sp.]HVV10054.1 TetR/AcrR family transcriptional regulator [Amycolatopsis sp.]
MSTSPKKVRADAERNRGKVLATARELFAERGEDVQLPEIARAAGVGVGTVYRHFPTKQALVEAAADQRFAEIAEYARAECLRSPVRGLEKYLQHVGEVLTADPGLSAAIQAVRDAPGTPPTGAARAVLEEVVAELIERGKQAGALREDLTTADVYLIVCGLSAVIRTGSGDWRRFNELAAHGFRQ